MTTKIKTHKTNLSFTLLYYLLKLFLPVFFVAIIFFVLVLVLGDMFYNMVSFMENKTSLKIIIRVIILYLPKCISYAYPIAMLFAGSYTLGNLYAKKELSVIFLSGISLLRFVLPLLIFAFLSSIGMFFFEDRIVIKTFSKRNELLKEITQKNKDLDASDVAIMSDFGRVVYIAEYYDDTNKILRYPKIVNRNDDGLFDIVITAESACWDDEAKIWKLNSPTVYKVNSENIITITSETSFEFLNEPPESFQRVVANLDEMNTEETQQFLNDLKKRGIAQNEYLVKYYQRFSHPFTIFIVLFLSISFGGYMKKNILLMSLLLSLSVAVLYYVTQMFMAVLASWNMLAPIIAAWLPFTCFFILSLYLANIART